MNHSPSPTPTADGRAEAWLARLSSPECTSADRAAFEDWLAESEANVDAYLQAESVHALARRLASDDLLRAAARRARRNPAIDRRSVLRRFAMGAAIAATVVLAIGVIRRPKPPPTVPVGRYTTVVGEQRTVALEDGTAMRLDTATTVRVHFARDQRVVEVVQGRVQFTVGADAPHAASPRPFLVKAGSGTVRDIGTTFQVRHVDADVEVGLIEGVVQVTADATGTSDTLAPGEQVRIDAQGALQASQPFDLAVARAWTQGDLVFKERRLDQLIAEMNRYSATPLRLADPALGALTVSGVFHIDDQAALVAALEQGWGLKARRGGNGEIVLHKADR
ncbi:FecR family protein [Lysobacter yangpyeongensis]|uniref:FecR family protein n=1 Tax=Lysobacter yangpyeongensis TaxID=346182 RepID=A0ABW0SHI4_9GAMM